MTYTPPQDEPTFRLASMAPPPRRRIGRIVALAGGGALVLVLAAGGIGYALAGKDDQASPAARASASSSTVATTAADAPGSQHGTAWTACDQFAAFSRGIADDNYGPADLPPLKTIGELAASSDSGTVAMRGMLLRDVVADAIASQGTTDAAKLLQSVRTYARDLRKSCALAGYPA